MSEFDSGFNDWWWGGGIYPVGMGGGGFVPSFLPGSDYDFMRDWLDLIGTIPWWYTWGGQQIPPGGEPPTIDPETGMPTWTVTGTGTMPPDTTRNDPQGEPDRRGQGGDTSVTIFPDPPWGTNPPGDPMPPIPPAPPPGREPPSDTGIWVQPPPIGVPPPGPGGWWNFGLPPVIPGAQIPVDLTQFPPQPPAATPPIPPPVTPPLPPQPPPGEPPTPPPTEVPPPGSTVVKPPPDTSGSGGSIPALGGGGSGGPLLPAYPQLPGAPPLASLFRLPQAEGKMVPSLGYYLMQAMGGMK